jgi:hypothetical protein
MIHDHAHEPTARDLGSAFKWAVLLNVSYVLIEAAAGLTLGSLALLADAAHKLTDVAGLLIAWGLPSPPKGHHRIASPMASGARPSWPLLEMRSSF